jgi:hypothetical protein
MRVKAATIFFIIYNAVRLFGQDSLSFNEKHVAKNNVSLDLGGVGIVYSVNYERNFTIKNNFYQTFKVGAVYFPTIDIGLPISYGYSIGKGKSKCMISSGVIVAYNLHPYPATAAQRELYRQSPTNNPYAGKQFEPLIDAWLYPVLAGYEFMSSNRFFFKAYATAYISRTNMIYYHVLPWAGFTFGFKLDKKKKN